jgi:hypothetical protein
MLFTGFEDCGLMVRGVVEDNIRPRSSNPRNNITLDLLIITRLLLDGFQIPNLILLKLLQ